MKPPKNPD